MDLKHIAAKLLRQLECADGVIITKKSVVEKILKEVYQAGQESMRLSEIDNSSQLIKTSCL